MSDLTNSKHDILLIYYSRWCTVQSLVVLQLIFTSIWRIQFFIKIMRNEIKSWNLLIISYCDHLPHTLASKLYKLFLGILGIQVYFDWNTVCSSSYATEFLKNSFSISPTSLLSTSSRNQNSWQGNWNIQQYSSPCSKSSDTYKSFLCI